jgi:hypothetical protein
MSWMVCRVVESQRSICQVAECAKPICASPQRRAVCTYEIPAANGRTKPAPALDCVKVSREREVGRWKMIHHISTVFSPPHVCGLRWKGAKGTHKERKVVPSTIGAGLDEY